MIGVSDLTWLLWSPSANNFGELASVTLRSTMSAVAPSRNRSDFFPTAVTALQPAATCTASCREPRGKIGPLANKMGLTVWNLLPYRACAGAASRVYSTAHPAGGEVKLGSYPCAPFLPTTLLSGAGTYFADAAAFPACRQAFTLRLAHGHVGLTRVRSLRYRSHKPLHPAVQAINGTSHAHTSSRVRKRHPICPRA